MMDIFVNGLHKRYLFELIVHEDINEGEKHYERQ